MLKNTGKSAFTDLFYWSGFHVLQYTGSLLEPLALHTNLSTQELDVEEVAVGGIFP